MGFLLQFTLLKCQKQALFVTLSSLSFVSETVTPAATLIRRLVPVQKSKLVLRKFSVKSEFLQSWNMGVVVLSFHELPCASGGCLEGNVI